MIPMFSIVNVILVILFSFLSCNTIAQNLTGFTITLFSLKHFTEDSDFSFKISRRPSVLLFFPEMVLTSSKW